MTGRLAQIRRHPVKSHGEEALEQVTLRAGRTLPWDRHWAVAHEAARAEDGEWAPCVNFTRGAKAPALMAVSSRLDETSGSVTFRHPELEEITLHPERDAARLLDWSRPLQPEGRAASARVVQAGKRGMTDTDFPSISLINLTSNRIVGQKLGRELDPRRWRANFWIDGLDPWEEIEWVGRRLRLGEVELLVRERITRCAATTANPATGRRDADTLGALDELCGQADFGVYAEVLTDGSVAINDEIEVLA
jgi:uncharacterized protein YcbX